VPDTSDVGTGAVWMMGGVLTPSWFIIDLSIQHPIVGGTLCSKFARIEGKKKYVK